MAKRDRKHPGAATAAESYTFAARRVAGYLELLQEKLAAHAEAQAKDPRNWGYAGDLEHIEELLKQAIGPETADAEALLTERANRGSRR